MWKRLAQSASTHRWRWLAAASLLGAACFYVANYCEACRADEFDTIRPAGIPEDCVEVEIPAHNDDAINQEVPRELPDRMEEVFDHMAVRRSTSVQNGYYVAAATTISERFAKYKGVREGHYSARKWMFVLAKENAGTRIAGGDGVTEEDWARAIPMKLAGAASDWPRRFEEDNQGIRFHGKMFSRTRAYLLGAPVISAGERWVTVLSASGWFPRGGEVLSPDFALEQIYHPARYFSVATYDANSAKLVREIHGWGCYGLFTIRDATTWYGDELLFVPSEGSRELVCRFQN